MLLGRRTLEGGEVGGYCYVYKSCRKVGAFLSLIDVKENFRDKMKAKKKKERRKRKTGKEVEGRER